MGSPSAPIFWVIFVALIINASYPAVLLVQRNARWNRRAVAVVDAVLDLIYSAVFMVSMLRSILFVS